MNFNAIDFGMIAIVVLLCLRGGWRGLVLELLSFLSVILAAGCTMLFFGVLMPVLFKLFSGMRVFGMYLIHPEATYSAWVNILTMIILFTVSFFIFKWLLSILPKLVENSFLDAPNHILGALVGFVESLFFIFIVIYIFRLQNVYPMEQRLAESTLFQWYKPFYNALHSGLGHTLNMIAEPIRGMFGAEIRRY